MRARQRVIGATPEQVAAIDALQDTAGEQLLFVLRNADMQIATDQAFTKIFSGTSYIINRIRCKRVSGAASALTAGGIYTAAAKGGSAIVLATQAWNGLSGAGKVVTPTLEALVNTDVRTETPVLSLTTGSVDPAVADLFVYGSVVDL